MLMPLAAGQLLHAFVLDRDCFPEVFSKLFTIATSRTDVSQAYGNFIMKSTPNYVQRRPPSYPDSLPWPTTNGIVDSLAEMAKLNWPYVIPSKVISRHN